MKYSAQYVLESNLLPLLRIVKNNNSCAIRKHCVLHIYSRPTIRGDVRWSVPRSADFTYQGGYEYQGYSGTRSLIGRISVPQSFKYGSTEDKPPASWTGLEPSRLLRRQTRYRRHGNSVVTFCSFTVNFLIVWDSLSSINYFD